MYSLSNFSASSGYSPNSFLIVYYSMGGTSQCRAINSSNLRRRSKSLQILCLSGTQQQTYAKCAAMKLQEIFSHPVDVMNHEQELWRILPQPM